MLFESVSYILALTFSTSAHIEHAEGVVFGHNLSYSEGFESTTSESVKVNNTLFRILVHFIGVFVFAVPYKSAFESFVSVIMNFGEIFDVEYKLIEVVC